MKPPRSISLTAFLVLLGGCFSDTPDRQIDQSVQGLYDAALSLNGSYSLIASIQHGASLWRTQDGERLYNWNHEAGSFSQVDVVALSGDGALGLTAVNRDLVSWNQKTGKSLDFWQLPGKITCLDLDLRGNYAVAGMESGQAMIIDIKQKGFAWSGKLSDSITSCHLTSKANGFALGSLSGQAKAFQISVKKAKDKKTQNNSLIVKELISQDHPYAISEAYIMPIHKWFASASRSHELIITDLRNKKEVLRQELKNQTISGIEEEKNFIIVANTNREIQFWNTETWQVIKSIQIPKRNEWKPSGVYIADFTYYKGQLTVSGTDGVTYIYSVAME